MRSMQGLGPLRPSTRTLGDVAQSVSSRWHSYTEAHSRRTVIADASYFTSPHGHSSTHTTLQLELVVMGVPPMRNVNPPAEPHLAFVVRVFDELA